MKIRSLLKKIQIKLQNVLLPIRKAPLWIGPSGEKYNQSTQRHQGPRIDHPRDKYNRNTHFFGHQKNPTDWPTPMEAELLKTLRKFLQTGPNRWGPARG